jgi:hypothetical protein
VRRSFLLHDVLVLRKACKVRYRKTDDGKSVRVSLDSGVVVPPSDESRMRRKPRPDTPSPVDTVPDAVLEETWKGIDLEVQRAIARMQGRRERLLGGRQPPSTPPRFVPAATRARWVMQSTPPEDSRS